MMCVRWLRPERCLVPLSLFLGFQIGTAWGASAAGASPERVLSVGSGGNWETIESALDRVAEIRKSDRTTPIAVEIAPGDYTPVRPLVVTPRHAMTNWAPLVVRAADLGNRPRVHG